MGPVAGSRILVVEDSDAIRLSILAALSAQGFVDDGERPTATGWSGCSATSGPSW